MMSNKTPEDKNVYPFHWISEQIHPTSEVKLQFPSGKVSKFNSESIPQSFLSINEAVPSPNQFNISIVMNLIEIGKVRYE